MPIITSERYLQFLRSLINGFIDDWPLAKQVNIYFKQDEAPLHNSHAVLELPNDTFPEKWPATYILKLLYFIL